MSETGIKERVAKNMGKVDACSKNCFWQQKTQDTAYGSTCVLL